MAADRVFGHHINGKGYRVIKGCGVIQGDGIDIEVMKKVGTVAQEQAHRGCMRRAEVRRSWAWRFETEGVYRP